MKLGLDQNDTVIRRLLQQKMEFLAEDFAAVGEPTDAELADYLAKHPDQFAQEQRVTFRQVFLNPEKQGDRLEADTTALLAELKQRGADANVSALGDSLLLPRQFTGERQRKAHREVTAQTSTRSPAVSIAKSSCTTAPAASG